MTTLLIMAALAALFALVLASTLQKRHAGVGGGCPFKKFTQSLERLRHHLAGSAKTQPRPGETSAEADGLGWSEEFLDGSAAAEQNYIEQAVKDIQEIQETNRKSQPSFYHRRALHARALACIEGAKFRVLDNVPPELSSGIFTPGAEYPVSLRFSNAAGKIQKNSARDLRGLAFSIELPEGERQDFLATNGDVSHARDARQFMEFARAMAGSKLLLIPRLLRHIGLLESIRMFRTLARQVRRPVTSIIRETFYSRAPFALDNHAFRFRLVPATDWNGKASGDKELIYDIAACLVEKPVIYEFQVQLYRCEGSTPIEDGSVEWQSPSFTIARLEIPQRQTLGETVDNSVWERIEAMEFNPWNCAKGIRPLGSLNRARYLVYKASAALRAGRTPFQGKGAITRSRRDHEKANKNLSACPFFGGGSAKVDNSGETDANFRPKSRRQGIGLAKYVYWRAFYFVLQSINLGLARNPYRKVSWDKWPPFLGLFYLLAKIRYNRSNALTDPYDYAANDTKSFDGEPPEAKEKISPDGAYVSDSDNPQMGQAGTRFGSNIPPRQVRPDVENMRPSARDVGKIRWRRTNPNGGGEITVPALILNDLAGWWIQFQFHGFGGNTKRDPVGVCPHLLPRKPQDNWPDNVAVVDRTSTDHTRLTDNGRPTVLNERAHAWIQAQVYGTSEDELAPLRLYSGGQLRLDEKGMLPEDPARPGLDLTGFSNNYGPGLSLLHWLFVKEHNAIAEHYAYFHPDWDDEKLFDMARRTNAAQISRIHTIEWTEDLLQHPTLQKGMHADWYGFLGQKAKMFLMRQAHRHPFIDRLCAILKSSDTIWGMPGSKWEHHDGPFQVPKQFRMVYRLHEMVLSDHEIIEPGTNRSLDRIKLLDFVHFNTRPVVERFGYEALAWSFVAKSAGALCLHNFPLALTRFENQQDGTLTDLAERDIFRERTDGTGTYNEFRQSVGERPVKSFMELTGGDSELARELEILYEGDIDRVDAGIGILAEPKPEGFALGFTQFYQFVLNAPRRVKSNRHLTELFTYDDYLEGMDWVEHGGGMLGVIGRHLPALKPLSEGVTRGFAPWPEKETFPLRQLDKTYADTASVLKADLRTLVLGSLAGGAALLAGTLSPVFVALVIFALLAAPLALAARRTLAMRFMQLVWKRCYTDKRDTMFGTLTRAEDSINRASLWGKVYALSVCATALALASSMLFSAPLACILWLLVAASGFSTWSWSSRFAKDAHVLKIALRNRMREGSPIIEPEEIAGDNDLQRRACFDEEMPAVLLHRSCITEERLYSGPVWADFDAETFERLMRAYAPGRDYLTAYDFARMREAESAAAAAKSRGNIFSRWLSRAKARMRTQELLHLFADRVVEEDKQLVPAVSKSMLIRFFKGTAQAELRREREFGDCDSGF